MKQSIEKRLSSYWRLELLNAVVLPALAVWLSLTHGWPLGLATVICLIPMCGLLVAGGLYWRAKLREITRRTPPDTTVRALARVQYPLLVTTVIGVITAATALAWPGARAGWYDATAATVAATLAVLEYVNYYHRQLQHFDRAADFQRLLKGRGFRPSKLREDMVRLGLRR